LLFDGSGTAVGVAGSELYFSQSSGGQGLYCTDGRSSASTVRLSSVYTPGADVGLTYPLSFAYKHELFFDAYGAGGGVGLWKSDGTPAGTVPVYQVASESSAGAYPEGFTVADGQLYFVSAGHHNDIYKTNGSSLKAVTHLQSDQAGWSDGNNNDFPQLTTFAGQLYEFDAFETADVPLVQIDAQGVATNVFAGLYSYDATSFDNSLFFQAVHLDDINSQGDYLYPSYLYQSNGSECTLVFPTRPTQLLGSTEDGLYFGVDSKKDGLTLYEAG
jgi:ELWxxDGT repeat protein